MQHLFFAAVIGLFLSVSVSQAQPEVLWSRVVPSSAEAEVCNDIIALGDEGYIVAGNSRRTAHHTRILTLLVGGDGSVTRRDTFGLADHRFCNAALRRANGELALAGAFTLNQANPHRNGFVMIADNSDSLVMADYGSTGVDQFYSIVQDTAGILVMAGSTTSYGAGLTDFWMVGAAPPETMYFNRTYGGEEEDECREVLRTADMGYLLAGMTRSYGPGSRNMFAIRTNAIGDSIWSQVIGSGGSQECNAAVMTEDGGFALAGHTNYEFWLVRLDASGNLLWSRIYDGYKCEDIILTHDGGFLLVGDIWSGGDAEWDGRVVRTDERGNELWSLTIDQEMDDHFYAASQTPGGGYIIGGSTNAVSAPDRVWLVRLNAEAPFITVSCAEAETPVVRGIAPVPGSYTIYSTRNPNHQAGDPHHPDWQWETTMPNVTPGMFEWSDPGSLEEHKYYIVTHTTL